MAIVASTWLVAHRGHHVGDLLHRPQRHRFDVEASRLGDAAHHVVERRPILGDGEAMARQLVDAGQAVIEGLVGCQDGGPFVAFLLVQAAADDFQRALFGQVEEAAGQRGDADIDVARNRRGGDRLGGFEEAERQVDAFVAEIAALLRDVERRGRQGVQQPEPQRFVSLCDGARPAVRPSRMIPRNSCQHGGGPVTSAARRMQVIQRSEPGSIRRGHAGGPACSFRGLPQTRELGL